MHAFTHASTRVCPVIAGGGAAGVARAIEILQKELDVTMALCGVKSVAEIDRNVLADTETQRSPQ